MRFARFAPSFLVCLLLVAGCGIDTPKTLMINNQQSLVMDPSVLTAGITAERPAIGDVQGQKRAVAVIHNNQTHPVVLHYRFYWYDRQGLDILPYSSVQTMTVPSGTTVTVDSTNGDLEAQQVRLYLYI